MKQFFAWKLRLGVLVTLIALGPGLGRGQDGQPVPLDSATAIEAGTLTTLEALAQEVLTNHLELKFYEAEIAAAKAGRKPPAFLPTPNWQRPWVTSVQPITADSPPKVWPGPSKVLQPFEWPGRLGLRKAIANRDVQLAELGLARFRVTLAGRVRSLAYHLFAAEEKATVAREVSERFAALRETLYSGIPRA